MNIYWGDLHNHCGITYGFGSLEHAIERAKSQLDFCAFTGHAMWPDMYEKRPETEFVVNFHEVGFKKLNDHWPEIREKVKKQVRKDLLHFRDMSCIQASMAIIICCHLRMTFPWYTADHLKI